MRGILAFHEGPDLEVSPLSHRCEGIGGLAIFHVLITILSGAYNDSLWYRSVLYPGRRCLSDWHAKSPEVQALLGRAGL